MSGPGINVAKGALGVFSQLAVLTRAVTAPTIGQAEVNMNKLKGTELGNVVPSVPSVQAVKDDPNALGKWQVDTVERAQGILNKDLGSYTKQLLRCCQDFEQGENPQGSIDWSDVNTMIVDRASAIGFVDSKVAHEFVAAVQRFNGYQFGTSVHEENIDFRTFTQTTHAGLVNPWIKPGRVFPNGVTVKKELDVSAKVEPTSWVFDVETFNQAQKFLWENGVDAENLPHVESVTGEFFGALGKMDAAGRKQYLTIAAKVVSKFANKPFYIEEMFRFIIAQINDLISEASTVRARQPVAL